MKQPSWKTPLILSTTLLVVGSFTYWLQYSHKPKQEKSDSLIKKPLGVTDDTQIASFKIKSVNGLIEAKCDEMAKRNCKVSSVGAWTITYPQTLKADPESIKSFVNDATNVLATETIDLSEETPEKRVKLMDEYGLSPEKRTDLRMQFVEVTLENGKRLTAWFGQEHPLGDKTFVARADDGVVNDKNIFLISNFFKSNFDKSLTFFRDKTLFEFDRSHIESFKAKTTGSQLDARLVNGAWKLNGFAGDYDRIETVLSAIAQLKAIEFPNASMIKGMKPIVTYDLQEKEQHYTLDLYEKTLKAIPRQTDPHDHDQETADKLQEKHYFVTVSNRTDVYEVQALIRSQIDKSISDLRNGILLSQAEKVTTTHVKFEGKGYPEAATFDFKGGSWSTSAKMEANNIPKLFDILTRERVKNFVPVPSGAHALSITLSMGDDKNAIKNHYQFFSIQQGKTELMYAIDLNSKVKEAMLLDTNIFKGALPFTPEAWKLNP